MFRCSKECGYPAWLHDVLQVKLPLEVGTFMECEWKQGQYHRAKIIERRKRSDAPDYEYYVHYIGCEFHTIFALLPVMLLQHSRDASSLHRCNEWLSY